MKILQIIGLQMLGILLWLIYFPLNVAADILSKVGDWVEKFTEPINSTLEDLLYSDEKECDVERSVNNKIES